MKQNDTVTMFQMTLIIMLVTGLSNHVFVIGPLIQTSGRDSWISVIFTWLLTFVWGLLLLFIHKGTNQEHLYSWLKKQVGKPVGKIIGGIVYLYSIVLATITLKETITWAKVTFLENTPSFLLSLLLIGLCMAAALTNFRTIAIISFFLLFFVSIFGFFVSFTNIQVKDYSLLRPVLENGYLPVIKGMIYPGAGMGELMILVFLQHKLKSKVRYSHLAWKITLLTMLTVGPLIGGIIEFGPQEAGSQRFTAFEEWGLVTLGRYFEHVDFLSIFQWLSGAFIRIAVLFYIAMEIFTVKKKAIKAASASFIGSSTAFLGIFPLSDIIYYQVLKQFILPFTVCFFFLLSLFLTVIVLRSNVRKKRGLSL